jgi:cyanophycinase-like exopeptidase
LGIISHKRQTLLAEQSTLHKGITSLSFTSEILLGKHFGQRLRLVRISSMIWAVTSTHPIQMMKICLGLFTSTTLTMKMNQKLVGSHLCNQIPMLA